MAGSLVETFDRASHKPDKAPSKEIKKLLIGVNYQPDHITRNVKHDRTVIMPSIINSTFSEKFVAKELTGILKKCSLPSRKGKDFGTSCFPFSGRSTS